MVNHLVSRAVWSGDCLIWRGAFTSFYKCKYGQLVYKGRRWLAHRLMVKELAGRIPKGKIVLHSCDNGLCINPKHLRIGTLKENLREAARKGRLANQQKTHCPEGHKYSAENTIIEKHKRRSYRRCRTCKENLRKRRYERTGK